MKDILAEIENIAKEKHDGHLTIMRFTTGWKAFYATPIMDFDVDKNGDLGGDRQFLWKLPMSETIDDALYQLLKFPVNIQDA